MSANPFALLHKAATGDIDAQRTLADLAAHKAAECAEADPYTTLMEGLVFARLASAHGSVDDENRVVRMLSLTAQVATQAGWPIAAETVIAEGIARVSRLADRGEEGCAMGLEQLMRGSPAETIQAAKQFEALLAEGGV